MILAHAINRETEYASWLTDVLEERKQPKNKPNIRTVMDASFLYERNADHRSDILMFKQAFSKCYMYHLLFKKSDV